MCKRRSKQKRDAQRWEASLTPTRACGIHNLNVLQREWEDQYARLEGNMELLLYNFDMRTRPLRLRDILDVG